MAIQEATSPFTLQQAESIKEEFQFLIGMDFGHERLNAGSIEQIAILPVEARTERYIKDFYGSAKGCDTTKRSPSGRYDVLLLARSRTNRDRWVEVDIRSWLLRRNFILKPHAFGQNWDSF